MKRTIHFEKVTKFAPPYQDAPIGDYALAIQLIETTDDRELNTHVGMIYENQRYSDQKAAGGLVTVHRSFCPVVNGYGLQMTNSEDEAKAKVIDHLQGFVRARVRSALVKGVVLHRFTSGPIDIKSAGYRISFNVCQSCTETYRPFKDTPLEVLSTSDKAKCGVEGCNEHAKFKTTMVGLILHTEDKKEYYNVATANAAT